MSFEEGAIPIIRQVITAKKVTPLKRGEVSSIGRRVKGG